MVFRQAWLAAATVFLGSTAICAIGSAWASPPPELISAFPLASQLGATFEVEVKGKGLQGVSAVWFECHDVRAQIKQITELNPGEDNTDGQDKVYAPAAEDPATHRVVLQVSVAPDAELGLHGFRLVTPRGMSNGLALQVVPEPLVLEGGGDRGAPSRAQVVQPPVVINGRMEDKGELDFYAIQAAEGDTFLFQTFSNFKPAVGYRSKVELALYEQSGSWFDASRINRIQVAGPALSWEPMYALTRWFEKRTFPTEFVLFPRLAHRFDKPGDYLVAVSSFLGAGAPEHFYALRIVKSGSTADAPATWFGRPAHRDPGDWLERDSSTLRQWGSFPRKLESTRLRALARRAVAPTATEDSDQQPPCVDQRFECEPNDLPQQAQELLLPVLVQGTIAAPADRDYFRFQATAGQKLAFEIETPRFAPPLFNPWLRIRDSAGQTLFSNIYKEYGGDGDDVNKNLERKTLYTFVESGTYTLEVRDLSLREGGPPFVYRILIRPQLPHLGRVELNLDVISESSVLVDLTDHINLQAGQSREIILVCEQEEGFTGSVAIAAENLPEGVELLASTASDRTSAVLTGFQYRPPGRQVMAPENYRPRRRPVTVILYARPDAPPATVPALVRLTARPLVDGRAGNALPVESFPLMVVARENNQTVDEVSQASPTGP